MEGIRKGSPGAVSFLRDDSVINFLLVDRERERESPLALLCCSFLLHAGTTRMCPLQGERKREKRMGFVEEWKIFNVLLFGRHRWPLLILFHFGSFLPELFHLAELNSWQVEWKVSSACSLRNGSGGIPPPLGEKGIYVELPISLIGFRDAFQDGGPRAELNIDVHLDNWNHSVWISWTGARLVPGWS